MAGLGYWREDPRAWRDAPGDVEDRRDGWLRVRAGRDRAVRRSRGEEDVRLHLPAVYRRQDPVPRSRVRHENPDDPGSVRQRDECAHERAEPYLGVGPAFARFHAEQPAWGVARDHGLLPRLPDVYNLRCRRRGRTGPEIHHFGGG